ncbi:MAG: amidohydrolase family protein [Gemmatimonadaceae bacterium]
MRTIAPVSFVLLLSSFAAPAAVGQQRSAAADTAVSRNLHAEQRDDPKFAPDRHEGTGPFARLIIRGATLIDGTGGPPRGPVDIVVEGNRIVDIASVGVPHVPIDSSRRPKGAAKEIDATGMYVMPGIVDLHVHQGTPQKAPESEYYNKLWLAHGITTVRGVPFASFAYSLHEKERSAKNEIAAPRYVVYQRPGTGWGQGQVTTPEQARAWVRWIKAHGADGLKLGAERPDLMAALLDEAKKLNMGSTAHLQQTGVGLMNADQATALGLQTVTHFYGLFESMYDSSSVQPYPVGQNYSDEEDRFGQVARQWNLVTPHSEKWKQFLKNLKDRDVTLDPTFSIYSAGRDLARKMNLPWHQKYTLPSLYAYYQPSRTNHGSYWYYWTTWDEVAFKNFYRVWMQFVNEYKNMGGKVTTGSDAGFIFSTPGFATIEEMEILQEAGFHPLEVIRSATMYGAQTLAQRTGKEPEVGIVRPGMLADMLVVDANPLENLKVLYGTGWFRLNDTTGKVEQVGGVKYTIKDGIVYDAKQLLADVARMVEDQRRTGATQAGQRAP